MNGIPAKSDRSNQLAHRLREVGVGPETLVAICLQRSLEMIVGLLGILKAGGAYVPMDPDHPTERLAFMLQDIGAPVLLTTQSLRDRLPETSIVSFISTIGRILIVTRRVHR
jgi:non-ribosomal peptide synthetase component F